MEPISAAIGLGSGLISGITGLIQRGKANKWLKNNPFPVEGIPREVLEGQGIANNMANTGLPSQQYNNAMKNIQRQQLTALSSAMDRRGALTALPYLTQQTNDAMANLDASDAEARMGNQRYAIGVNNQVANLKRDLYDKNIRNPYMMKRDEMMNQKAAGNINLTSGVDKFLAGGIGLFGGGRRRGSGNSGGMTTAGYGADFDNYGMSW